jgi:PAS domain S-box-containing protein
MTDARNENGHGGDTSMEDALHMSVSDAIIAISADAIISVDESRKIIRYNSGAADIFGYSAAEVIGRTIETLIPQRFRAKHPDQIRSFADSPVVARRMGERRQISGLRKNGEEFPAEASISKTKIDGEWIFTVALRDVTERVRAEEAQRFLSHATELLNNSLDAETAIQNIAKSAIPFLGDWCVVFLKTTGEMFERALAVHKTAEYEATIENLKSVPFTLHADHPLYSCLHDGKPLIIAPFDDAMREAWSENAYHRQLLEQLDPCEVLAAPLNTREWRSGAICFFLDAKSARHYGADDVELAIELARRTGIALDNARLYAIARDAVAARDDVLSIVSHDLGNPLSAIRLSATVLSKLIRKLDTDSTEDIEHQVENIRLSVTQMQRLIKDLLDIRRIESGILAIERDRIAVTDILDEVTEMYQALAEARGIRFETHNNAAGNYVHGDHERVVQVFSNLVGNALKFTPAGNAITVEATSEGDGVAFTVRDEGPGIPAEHVPHLFDRFWQARRTGRHGIGLGLTIAKGIIDAHGGTMRVTSELGTGSAFTFTIPGR